MIDVAKRRARAVQEALAGHLDASRDVVVIEPSDLVMVKRDCEKLLPQEEYERLHDHSYDVMAYIGRLLQDDDGTVSPS